MCVFYVCVVCVVVVVYVGHVCIDVFICSWLIDCMHVCSVFDGVVWQYTCSLVNSVVYVYGLCMYCMCIDYVLCVWCVVRICSLCM